MGQDSERCFHCNLPIPAGTHYSVVIDDESKPMCCPGCEAVAQAIIDNGLNDYYKYRTEHANLSQSIVPEELLKLDLYDRPELQEKFVYESGDNIKQASLVLEGIVCAACVWLSEQHVSKLPGVISFQVNYSTHRAQLKWDDNVIKLSAVLKAISEIGYLAHPLDPNRQEQLYKKERSAALRRLAVAGFGAMQVMMLAVALYAGAHHGMDETLERFLRWVSLFITTPVLLYSARVFFKAAWRDLKLRSLGMDVPVSLAIGGAYLASVWATLTHSGEVYYDSVTMFTFFLLTGRYLEMTARQRAGRAAEELVKLIPAMATRVNDDAEEVVAVGDLSVGDILIVRPGESIPADGIVIDGVSSVDESLLTGESIPILKQASSKVIGGSVNTDGVLKFSVEKLGQDTVLAAIQRLLDRAQSEKPRLARLADRVAGYFVFVLLVVAAVVGFYWWQHDPDNAFWIVISILVVTCPCALSLATPTALTAATGQLTKYGLLTTRGHALETLAKIDHIIFDKTGTLTYGRPVLQTVQLYAQLSESEVLKIAASLERFSEHPIAKGIVDAYQDDNYYPVNDVMNMPGHGIQGMINGERYFIGNAAFILQNTDCESVSSAQAEQQVILASQQQVIASLVLEDSLRPAAEQIVTALQEMGIEPILLSGDRQWIVDKLAKQLGFKHAVGELLPEDKLKKLNELQSKQAVVAMVGDGINDAPVLSAAQVSIAMGQGTQIAQASADMILLSDDLQQLVMAIETARKMRSIVRQNLTWALVYNLVALPIAALGWVPPWAAAIGMSTSSLVVVMNALRLTHEKSPPEDIQVVPVERMT